MCGIFASIGLIHNAEIDSAIIASLKHRGPDSNGLIDLGEGYRLGMTRLIIRGSADIAVPFDIDGSHIVAFNGEIYGTLDKSFNLTNEVPCGGDKEIEFFIEKYKQFTIDGMFSIFMYDKARNSLHIFRDRDGIKPLFFKATSNTLVVASEIKTLLISDNSLSAINIDNIHDHFMLGFSTDNSTAFANICEIAPSSCLQINDKKAYMDNFNTLPTPHTIKFPMSKNLIRTHVRQSLERCILANESIGVAISGGLDSSIIAYELNSMGVNNVKTFSVITNDTKDGAESLNFLDGCVNTTSSYKTWEHNVAHFTPENFIEYLEKSINIFSQPTRMTSFPLYVMLAELVHANDIRVLLTGEGVDEVFAGYEDYIEWYTSNEQKAAITQKDVLKFFINEAEERFYRDIFGDIAVDACINRFTDKCLTNFDFSKPLQSLLALERNHRLRQLLLRSDLCLMRESVEGRTPFLHGGLKEKIYTLDDLDLISQNKISKNLLRDAYADALPSYTIPKVRFRIPIDTWFANELNAPIRKLIVDYSEHPSSTMNHVCKKVCKNVDELLRNNANFIYKFISCIIWENKFKDHILQNR